jgi:quinol monooxygenase YgiN
MTAMNIVRFRTKPGREEEFVEAHRQADRRFGGMRKAALVRTGEGAFCLVGEWDDMESLAAARPAMIATLDGFRDLLEDLGGGLGVTDPVSGEVVVEIH